MTDGSDDVAQRYQASLARLRKMLEMDAPPMVVAAECVVLAHLACKMGQIPLSGDAKAEEVMNAIREKKKSTNLTNPEVDKLVERMRQEIHFPGCPAYPAWIENAMPAAPGECTCIPPAE